MRRYLSPLLIFLALASLLGFGLSLGRFQQTQELPSPLIGRSVPNFRLERLHQGGQWVTPNELQGQVWILNVWASWCVSCRVEHPVWLKYKDQLPAQLIGLNYKDQSEAARAWVADFGDPYRYSLQDVDGRTGIDFGVYGVPETFVIDAKGVVRQKLVGVVTDAMVQQQLLPLLQRLQQEAQAQAQANLKE